MSNMPNGGFPRRVGPQRYQAPLSSRRMRAEYSTNEAHSEKPYARRKDISRTGQTDAVAYSPFIHTVHRHGR